MHRLTVVVLVVAMLLAAVAAQAQMGSGTARYLGMGGTGIAAADDAGAIDYNPANLGMLELRDLGPEYDVKPPQPDEPLWMAQGQLTSGVGGDLDYTAFHAAALYINHVHKKHGFGLSFQTLTVPGRDEIWTGQVGSGYGDLRADTFTLGYGHPYYYEPWSWGLSWTRMTVDSYYPAVGARALNGMPGGRRAFNALNGGLLWRWAQPQGDPIRVGLSIIDLLDDTGSGPLFGLGVSAPLGEQVVINADWVDVTDRASSQINVGAEVCVVPGWHGRLGMMNVTRANDMDDTFTLGAGRRTPRWNFDAAWLNATGGMADQWVVSAGYRF